MIIKKIDHRFHVLSLLGSGTSGDIFEVEGPEGKAALKLLKSSIQGLSLEEQVALFKFEFSLLKELLHPHLIRIFDFGYDEALARFYFTQEFLPRAILPPPDSEASLALLQKLAVQVLQGLAYLQDHRVIHGDIKPENLLVYRDEAQNYAVKIIDFGLSNPQLALRGGTPSFMAPEKILREKTDSRSDLYSLGVVLYGWFSGKNPFVRPSVAETLQAQLRFQAPPVIQLNPRISPVWSELIQKLLIKNPQERIFSAEACLKFLEERGEIQAREHPPALHLKAWVGREEILKEAKTFVQACAQPDFRQALGIWGDASEGEALLSELKYEAQLQGVEVLFKDQEPSRRPSVYFFKPKEIFGDFKIPLQAYAQKAPVIFASAGKKIGAPAVDFPHQNLFLRPLTNAEIENYLRTVTRNSEIPAAFLQGLLDYSGRSIRRLNQALKSLFKNRRLVQPSGKWNLAIFQESGPTLEDLGYSEEFLTSLEKNAAQDPDKLWPIQSERISQRVEAGDFEEALRILTDFEEKFLSTRDAPFRRKAQVAEKKGWIYSHQGRSREAREQWELGLSILAEQKTPPSVLQLRLKNFLAYLDLREGQERRALKVFEETWDAMLKLDVDAQKKVRNNELGATYLALGLFEQAADFLARQLRHSEDFDDDFLSMKLAYQLAEALSKMQNYEAARKNYQRCASLARAQKSWDYLLRAYNGLGNIASLQKQPQQALDFYRQSLALAEYNHDYLAAATVAQNRGVIFAELGRFEEAERELQSSKHWVGRSAPSAHSRYLMARTAFERGELCFRQGDWTQAKSFYQEALSRVEEEESLKYFRFYPLAGLTRLALVEKDGAFYRQAWPELWQLAKSDSEKKMLQEISEARDQAVFNPKTAPPATSAGSKALHSSEVPPALLSILNINRALISEQDPQLLFKKILEYASDLSGAESALLLEVGPTDELFIRSAFNTSIDQGQKEMSQQIAQEVLKRGQSLVTHDALGDDHFKNFESVIHLQLRSVACIPIRFHQKVLGLLYLAHRHKIDLFQDEVLSLLEAFADQAGLALHNARQVEALKSLNRQLQQKLEHVEAFIDDLKSERHLQVVNPYPKILGQSSAIRGILALLDRVSDTLLSVLILGETGSGKELVARAIHENSRRARGPFIAINCGAIPENLIESELFGYTSGAFTGATRDKKGLFEEAQSGTLFLDEVAELPPNLQVKLLRALQEKEIYRLGSSKAIPLDLRVVAASHRSIEQWVREGKFREDLYYRLAQMVLQIPPLRERLEDLPLLVEHFCRMAQTELQLEQSPHFEKSLLQKMMEYSWPGNIRELENMVRTASAFSEAGRVGLQDLPDFLRNKLLQVSSAVLESKSDALSPKISSAVLKNDSVSFPEDASPKTWKALEAALLAQRLSQFGNDFQKVAHSLQVGIATVYLKVRQYRLKDNLEARKGKIEFPLAMSLQEFKLWAIQQAYERLKNPQAVARELEMSVGTIYRYIQNQE